MVKAAILPSWAAVFARVPRIALSSRKPCFVCSDGYHPPTLAVHRLLANARQERRLYSHRQPLREQRSEGEGWYLKVWWAIWRAQGWYLNLERRIYILYMRGGGTAAVGPLVR